MAEEIIKDFVKIRMVFDRLGVDVEHLYSANPGRACVDLSFPVVGGPLCTRHHVHIECGADGITNFIEEFHKYTMTFDDDEAAIQLYFAAKAGGHPTFLETALKEAKATWRRLRKIDDGLFNVWKKDHAKKAA